MTTGQKDASARFSPSPFAERGEKVAEGRMRGGATNADARNPSPRPSPLAPQRARDNPMAASTTPATVLATQQAGNPLAMNRISQNQALQTPCPAAQGALPGWKRCLTFSEKVANLFGKAALPFRQGCHTLWDRAGQPRRPGALTSTSWPGTTARTGLNYVPEVTWQKGLGHRLDFYRAGNK